MENLFKSVVNGAFTLSTYFICIGFALLCGVIVALAMCFRNRITHGFFAALVLLPAVVSTVITMVNGNIGTGIAVAGAFSLIRFRSVAGKAKEIAAVFIVMTAGLTCSAGYVAIAVLFTLVVSAGMIALTFVPMKNDREMDLRITVPETLNFTDAFEDILKEYTKEYKLQKVSTTNMGSMYKLRYRIQMKDRLQTRDMMDKIRCRNGNLEVSVSETEEEITEL